MQFRHHDLQFDVPDEWWASAGMSAFVPSARAYPAGESTHPALGVIEVAIADVQPVRRSLSHGVFNDAGPGRREGTAQERVLRILGWFRGGEPVEPVCVAELADGAAQRFELVEGAHRFYCAVAAGFSHVPAVKVVNTWRKA